MPANAGIQIRFRLVQIPKHLDSGLRRNDGNKRRLLVDAFETPRLAARSSSVGLASWIKFLRRLFLHADLPQEALVFERLHDAGVQKGIGVGLLRLGILA
jgi:hypothetical protein